MTINFPTGFRESLEFKRLLAALSSNPASSGRAQCIATDIFFSVFQTLYNSMTEGGQPGQLSTSDQPILISEIAASGENGEYVLQQLVGTAKLLVQNDDGFFCPMFERYNKPGGGNTRMQSEGGKKVAFDKRVKKVQDSMMGEALKIPAAILTETTDAGGQPLDAAKLKRIQSLIVRCDLALGKQIHAAKDYTAELIANALLVVEVLTDGEIAAIMNLVIKHRATKQFSGHPALIGLTTEKLLPRFMEMKQTLEPEA